MRIDGLCHCGNIRYEAEIEPEKVGVCHCTDCQTLSGSAFNIYAPAPAESFRLLAGEPKIYVKTAESGNRRAQAFCPECGTRLYACAVSAPKVLNIRVGSMRQRRELVPHSQLWCRSALDWVTNLGSVKRFDKQPLE